MSEVTWDYPINPTLRETTREERFTALAHWEKMFRGGTLDDKHADFLADTLAAAREKLREEDEA